MSMLHIMAAHPTITEYRGLLALCAVLEREWTSVGHFLPTWQKDVLPQSRDLTPLRVCRM